MGGGYYDSGARLARSTTMGYTTKGVDEIFTQQKSRQIHESMNPNGIDKRECRDSEAHPNSFPIIASLDVTGSMGGIPHDLVKEGLPKLMGKVIQYGTPDASLLFLAVGDHECDRVPLQVGQFESGDLELDTWLTRTFIEGGGGGNSGESYLLAWYFAANHTVTDHFEKRGKKGLLFTVGDEPCLRSLPKTVKTEIMGKTARGQATTDKELLEEAKKMYDVYHIHILQGSAGARSVGYWCELLGDNCIEINDFRLVPDAIAKIAIKHSAGTSVPVVQTVTSAPANAKVEEILL